LAVVLAMLPGVLAFGQSELPAQLTTSSNLSPSDEQAVAEWAEALWAQVDRQNPEAAREARRRLVEPLLRPETSAAFRISMDRALGGSMQAAMDGEDVYRGVNAALLSGWLGTDRSVRSLTGAVQSDRIALRFAAVSGLGYAFRVAGIGPVAFQGQVGNQAVDALGDLLARSNDRSMLDATVKSLTEAMAVPEAAIAGFGARSGEKLTQAVGERLNTLPIDDQLGARVTPLLRAMAEIRGAVTQRRGSVSNAWRDGIMELYGRAGALGFRYLRAERAGTLQDAEPERTRATIESMLQVASTMPTTMPQLSGELQTRLGQFQLRQSFASATEDGGNAYGRAINDLIRLLGNEFALPRERFNMDN
jgi:hypothetical protein